MQLQLLPSTFDENGCTSSRQHLSCFVIDDRVAIDAGSLAMATTNCQKEQIRDIVLTHAHLDHIAGLPLFIDDLFATLRNPINIYATREVIDVLEANVFNWDVYPRFSELTNVNGAVLQYQPFNVGKEFKVKHLNLKAVNVNHKVPSVGFIISDGKSTIALSSDTAKMKDFWEMVNGEKKLNAVLVECAFPNQLKDLAEVSHHLTPDVLKKELKKLKQKCPVFVINLKPMYRDEIVGQLDELKIENLHVLTVGKKYEW
ncbi:MAG: 3',5'-cyclic-nucleotide phosphodiesterase [Pyrinomonadaceae bacterium]